MKDKYPKELYETVENRINPKERVSLQNLSEVNEKNPPHISSIFAEPQVELICDDDDRELKDARQLPNNLVCRLLINVKNGKQYTGTGFFISPRCVITSGHCVFLKGSWVESIIVIPGDNGESDRKPFGSQKSKKFRSVKGWTRQRNRDFDYGAIILKDEELYQNIKAYFHPKEFNNESELINYGYTDEPDKRCEQWGSIGEKKTATSHRIYYMNDTVKGNSGSPIIVKQNNISYVVGIHSYGDCPNYCVKINKSILQVWEEWKNL